MLQVEKKQLRVNPLFGVTFLAGLLAGCSPEPSPGKEKLSFNDLVVEVKTIAAKHRYVIHEQWQGTDPNGDVVCVITDLHSPEVAKQTAEFSKELHSEGILDLLGREGVPEFDAEKTQEILAREFFDRCIGPLNPESTWEGFWALNSKPGPLEAPFLNAQLPTVGLEPNSTYRNYLAAFNLFSIEYEFLSKTLNAENIPIWETGDKKQMLVFESPIGAEIDDSIARINYWESVLREGFPSIPSLREDFISHTQTGATCIFIEDQAYFNAHHQAVIDWTNINLNWPRNKTAPTVLRQQMHRVHAHRAGMVYGAKHTVHRGAVTIQDILKANDISYLVIDPPQVTEIRDEPYMQDEDSR